MPAKIDVINGSGWEPDETVALPFSMSVEGLEGTGKTFFGLMTCPTPIVHVNFSDRSALSFLYDMSKDRRTKAKLYSFSANTTEGWTRDEGKDSLIQLSRIAQEEMAGGKLAGGTFILDSGSTWWDVVQEVYVAPEFEKRELEGKKQRGGIEYGKGNLIINGVVSWLKNQGAFVVLTHRKTAVWDKDGPVKGQFTPQMNRKVRFLVEVRLDLHKKCAVCKGEECTAPNHVGRLHTGRLIKFGKLTALEGMEIDNPTFSDIYKMYYGREFPNQEALK